jgi:EF-hand domain pair
MRQLPLCRLYYLVRPSICHRPSIPFRLRVRCKSTNEGTASFLSTPTYKVNKISIDGQIVTSSMRTSEILKDSSIYARDLVSLQLTTKEERRHKRRAGSSPHRTLSAILPRGNEILLSFGAIRAVVGTKDAWIFDAHSVSVREFTKELSRVLKQGSARSQIDLHEESLLDHTSVCDESLLPLDGGKSRQTPPNDDLLSPNPDEAFELVFLEAVLRDTTDVFNRRIRLYDPIVDSFLDKVANEVFSDSGVHLLVPLKDSLQGFEMHVKQCLECLTELLNNEDDLLSLLITEHEIAHQRGLHVDKSRHADVELLLEEYARQLNNCLFEINYMLQRLQSKQEFVQLALSSYRNRMIRMNLYISITGLSLGISTAIAGFFGMNLINGLESHPSAFQVVIAATCFAGAAVSATCFSYVSGVTMQKRAKQRLTEIQTLNSALSDMDALDVTIKKLLRSTKGMTREEFHRRLATTRTSGQVTQEEVDLLFNAMDQQKDGILLHDDFESLLQLQKEQHAKHKVKHKSDIDGGVRPL